MPVLWQNSCINFGSTNRNVHGASPCQSHGELASALLDASSQSRGRKAANRFSVILWRLTMRPADAYRLKYRSDGTASQTIDPEIETTFTRRIRTTCFTICSASRSRLYDRGWAPCGLK